MPRKGTKAAEIMRLYAEGLSTSEIAKAVGCGDSYVRVVARQRKGTGVSRFDLAYRTRLRRGADLDAARMDGRLAYDMPRMAGATRQEACWRYARAYDRTMRRTAHA